MDIISVLEGKPFMTEFGIGGYSTVVLIRDEDKVILYDCGSRGCALQLKDGLARAEVTPQEVTHVVLSHLHFDHTGNLPLFKGAKVLMSRTEWDAAQEEPDEWHCRATCEYIKNCCDVSYVSEGTKITDSVTVIELPGHTPGLIGLRCGEDTILCSDAVKNRFELWENIPLMTVDPEASRRSAERIRREAVFIYPGHDTVLDMRHPINKDPIEFNLRFADGKILPVRRPASDRTKE